MADQCCAGKSGKTALNDPKWRRILWIALLINAAMFGVEIVAGVAAESRALQADDCSWVAGVPEASCNMARPINSAVFLPYP